MTEEKQTELSCYNCEKNLGLNPGQKIHRSEECPHCYANLHSCKMCEFYDTSAYNECRETQADRILEKENANFCDYFVLRGSGSGGGNSKEDILSAANSLFKS
ncbi:MAG: hypothetical protein KC493_07855 [Bacteriovoracaceae bacterium]|nr:hypothetical protein [Bacteriovoracaceae bacterium]